jgi:NarL family two-component system response regulator LiaR
MIHAANVDDNDELRAAMTQYLQTQKDIAIVGEASNGQDALKMIQEKQPEDRKSVV